MAFGAANLVADFLRFDGLEAVTYRELAEDGTYDEDDDVEIENALWFASTEQLILNGRIVAESEVAVCHFLRTEFEDASDSAEPKRERAVLIDLQGKVWVIHRVELKSWRTRYKLTCVRQS